MNIQNPQQTIVGSAFWYIEAEAPQNQWFTLGQKEL